MGTRRTYCYHNSSLTLEFGDITTSRAQVLVSSDDQYLSMGGGVSASILRAGGNAIAVDAAKKVPAALGDIVITTSGTLPAEYIFHAVTIGATQESIEPEVLVRQLTRRCMQMLGNLQLSSIAFPAIGSGVAGFSYEDVAVAMSEVICEELLTRQAPAEVTIYLFDRFRRMKEVDFIPFFEQFAARVPRLTERPEPVFHEAADAKKGQSIPLRVKDADLNDSPETERLIAKQRLHNLRTLIGCLEDQRYKLEERLVSLIGSEQKPEIRRLRRSLQENGELRLTYLNELKSLQEGIGQARQELDASSVPSGTATHPPQPGKPRSVFVSSTYKDLIAHRAAVKDAIVRRDLLFRGMESFGADPGRIAPAAKIVDEVRKADVYVGILGVRYGSVDPATGLSMTELEFNEAETSGKPMLVYVIRDDARVSVADMERDPAAMAKLDDFRRRIMSYYTVYPFDTEHDLARQVYEDLGKLLA
jgi:O-acetyl-ADP-ribose deacetylase (regulator of RNase III)